jgi:hypothetical protein
MPLNLRLNFWINLTVSTVTAALACAVLFAIPVAADTVIGGVVYQADRATSIGAGREVILGINGNLVATTTTNGSGNYNFSTTEDTTTGDIISLYLNNNMGELGNTIVKVNNIGDTYPDAHIYQDHLTIDNRGSSPITSANLLAGHTGSGFMAYSQSDLQDDNILNVGMGLFVPDGKTASIASITTIADSIVLEGTLTMGSTYNLDIDEDLELADGTLNFTGSGDLTVGDTFNTGPDSTSTFSTGDISATNLHVSGADFVAPSGTITINGIFSVDDNSTFDANEGTVNFVGENLILGLMEFYNLTKIMTDSNPGSLTFESDRYDFNVSNNLTLQGFSNINRLIITSTGSNPHGINLSNTATVNAYRLHISKSQLDVASGAATDLPILPASSIDGGNTFGWFDTWTEPAILNSPSSGSKHSTAIPVNFTLPDAMLSGSLAIILFNSSHTIELTLADIAANTPKIFQLDINNALAGGHIVSATGLTGNRIPDGTYDFVVVYQDALANPAAFVERTNVQIKRQVASSGSTSSSSTVSYSTSSQDTEAEETPEAVPETPNNPEPSNSIDTPVSTSGPATTKSTSSGMPWFSWLLILLVLAVVASGWWYYGKKK